MPIEPLVLSDRAGRDDYLARAVQSMEMAVSDIHVILQKADSGDECLRIAQALKVPIAILDSAQGAAMRKADEL